MDNKFPFLKDLQDWCTEHDREALGSKALRIMNKARLAGKEDLAVLIQLKYGRHFPKFDRVIAFGMVLKQLPR